MSRWPLRTPCLLECPAPSSPYTDQISWGRVLAGTPAAQDGRTPSTLRTEPQSILTSCNTGRHHGTDGGCGRRRRSRSPSSVPPPPPRRAAVQKCSGTKTTMAIYSKQQDLTLHYILHSYRNRHLSRTAFKSHFVSFTPENECGLDILYKYLCIHVRKYRPSDEVLKMVRGFADAYENTMSGQSCFIRARIRYKKEPLCMSWLIFFFLKRHYW